MTETTIGKGEHFAIYENNHGFRITRLTDGAEVTFYGDDSCEEFRNQFEGDEYADDPAENASEADEFGHWLEREQMLPQPKPGEGTHEYAFDVTLTAAIRVIAASEADARRKLKATLDAADSNLGAWADGSPILCEVSLDKIDSLYEVDGVEV